MSNGGGRCLSLLLLTSRRRSVVSHCLRQKRVFVLSSGSAIGTSYMVAYRSGKVCRVGDVTICPRCRHRKCKERLVTFILRRCGSQYRAVLINAKSDPLAVPFCRDYKFTCSRQMPSFFVSGCSRPVFRKNGRLGSVVCLGEALRPGWCSVFTCRLAPRVVRTGLYRDYKVPLSSTRMLKAGTSNDLGRRCYACYCRRNGFTRSYAVSRVVRRYTRFASRFGGSSKVGFAGRRTVTNVGRFFPALGH